jgi:hypothetical protein
MQILQQDSPDNPPSHTLLGLRDRRGQRTGVHFTPVDGQRQAILWTLWRQRVPASVYIASPRSYPV